MLDTLVGANPPELTKRVEDLAKATPTTSASENAQELLYARLKSLIESAKVMAFIKGTVDDPKCGFTKKLLTILKETSVPFSTFNILTDNSVREGLKVYSSWPTYPQLYVDGKLVGGVDIVQELHADGSLVETLNGA